MVDIPAFFRNRRRPPRPRRFRQKDYLDLFDSRTLLYGAIYEPEVSRLVLVGPPPLNTIKDWKNSVIRIGSSSSPIALELENFDRLFRATSEPFHLSEGDELSLNFKRGSIAISPEVSEPNIFKGGNVLLTLSKDNPVEWIRDWALFHVKTQGVNAVLLFDNASTTYRSNEIKSALRKVPGLEVAVVVDWPFKFGPPAMRGTRTWDSDFCKHGFFEYARIKYLSEANWVLNVDIDELLLSTGQENLSSLLSGEKIDQIYFSGKWVFPKLTTPKSLSDRKFSDSLYLDNERPLHVKWAVRPQLSSRQDQWKTHRVGSGPQEPISSAFELRHFWNMSTSWKYPREADVTKHDNFDTRLAEEFSRLGWQFEE